MDGSLWIGILGVVLGVASLTWQAATYALTGGRIKVTLRVGAMGPGGLVTGPPAEMSADQMDRMAAQGYRRPVAAVRVANVGRQPVTVAQWGLKSTYGLSVYPVADSIGPTLPRRLDVGEAETWAVDLAVAKTLTETAEKTLGKRRANSTTLLGMVAQGWRNGRGKASHGIVGVAELADGRSKRSTDRLR